MPAGEESGRGAVPGPPRSLLAPRVPAGRRVLLQDCVVWTGEAPPPGAAAPGGGPAARAPFRGAVLLRGNTVARVLREGDPPPDADAVVRCGGRSVIPGLVEGHAHVSFEDIVQATDPGDMPPEEATLVTVRNCGRLLSAGFTSAFSAASARVRLDAVARDWVNAGHAPGPRLLAASPEICSTGCLGDFSRMHQQRGSFGLVADGAEELRRAVRLCIREGADTVKINIGGDIIPVSMMTAAKDDVRSAYTDEEVAAACDEAHRRGARVAAHCRGSGDVRLALRHGVDVIYHCDFAGKHPEILDALAAARDRVFLGPAVGLMDALAPGGLFKPAGEAGDPDIGVLLAAQKQTYAELRRRGVRVVIGGDYGFRVTPQGSQANDLALFREHFGYSAEGALVCATRHGGELMGLRVGQLREGWLADLLIVDGRPWEDPAPLLAGASCGIRAVVQDGHFHRCDLPGPGGSTPGGGAGAARL